MRSKKRTIGILIVVIVLLLGFASSLLVYRNKLSSEKTKNNSNNNTAQSLSSAPSGISIENFYDKPITDEKIALDSIEVNRDKLGYSDKNFTFIYDEKSSSETAYHFDLYYKDIPVYSPVGIRGVSVITYYDNSADVLITGVSDSEKIIKVNTTPKITQDELKDIIKRQFSIEEDINSKLIVYETSEEYVLAYYIEYSFYIYIINAENGEIIDSSSMLVSNSAEYEGQNGDIHQIFYNDYTDETKDIKNALWDNEKNIFIVNNRWGYELFGKKSSEGLFTTEDLKLGNNKSAIDGMANAYRAVEFFEKKFDYTFDSTYVSVNVDKDKDKKGNTKKDNACGTYAKVNDDNIAYLFFLVSSDKDKAQWTAYLDLVAHEYTHAITGSKAFGTGYSKDSKYYEKNALMEAYSDIFGELVEKEYTGSTDWKNYNLRNISEPKIKKYTKRYITEDKQGTDDNDYGGAHQNSTIISHVAYLMSKSNDSKKYDAEFLLDYNQLAQLWYGSLEYLKETEFMDFSDCRYAVEKSARKLIKEGVLLEDNLKVIEQAFNDVEVISNPARHGAENGVEIKEKHTATVPIENETQSPEPVKITEQATTPTEPTESIPKEAQTIVNLSLGKGYSGCIDNNGNLYMWGNDLYGNLGDGSTNDSSTPIKIMDNVKGVSLGSTCSAAITKDGSLYMWGDNEHGKLGNGSTNDSSIPIKIMDNVKAVSLGYEHNAVITEEGSLYLWGSNKYGKLGNGTTNDSLTPVKIMDNVKAVSLGSEHSGAITEDGSLYMWGANWCYQLGNGTREDSLTPIKIMDNVKTVTLGSSHNAAITEDGNLYMWGYNDEGQVGNETTNNITTPVKIMDNVKAVSLGSEHSGAITEDGNLYMWGDNFYNQLGYSVAKSPIPTKVLDNIKLIDFAGCQSSAITEDNVLYMWGRETNITVDNVLSVSIGQLSYGNNHYGVIKTDGSLYMWGDNLSGELGNGKSGTYAKSSTPIKIEIGANSSLSNKQIINSINEYLQENWCGENQYYCFESELIENEGYWWVCIRWDGSNSANVITGNDCKINKETGEVEISFNGKPYEWFNLKDYQ